MTFLKIEVENPFKTPAASRGKSDEFLRIYRVSIAGGNPQICDVLAQSPSRTIALGLEIEFRSSLRP